MNTNPVLIDRQQARLSLRSACDDQLDGLSKKRLRALVLSLARAKDPAKPDVVIAVALSEIERHA